MAPALVNRTTSALCVSLLAGLLATLGACSRPPAASGDGNQPAPPQPTAPPADVSPLVEGLPEARVEAMATRDAAFAAIPAREGVAPMYVLAVSKRWTPGQTLTVAFKGGSEDLHRRIAQVAGTWTLFANIGLDFGYEPGRGYRTWSPADTYMADIRIAFDETGHFSCVGRDSIDPKCATPRQSSMNYYGFDLALPSNWQSIVLHEWGHALGLEHEHQNPEGGCEAEFRWDDDPGYEKRTDARGAFIADAQGRRPGVYTVLSGPPNLWPRAKVDRNMRQLEESRAIEPGKFDPQSIMKYEFEEWMYVSGRRSKCFSRRNSDLSPLDRAGIARLYPRAPADVLTELRSREKAIASLRGDDRLDAVMKGRLDKATRDLGELIVP
jgi:hypothetical protein